MTEIEQAQAVVSLRNAVVRCVKGGMSVEDTIAMAQKVADLQAIMQKARKPKAANGELMFGSNRPVTAEA